MAQSVSCAKRLGKRGARCESGQVWSQCRPLSSHHERSAANRAALPKKRYCESLTAPAEVEKLESRSRLVFEDEVLADFRDEPAYTMNGVPRPETDHQEGHSHKRSRKSVQLKF